jgi:hypothetical protein
MAEMIVGQQGKTESFLRPAKGMLQRTCACGNHTAAGGECAQCAKNRSGLQPKLAIGATNDPLEQEADRAADQAVAALAPFALRLSPSASPPPSCRRSPGGKFFSIRAGRRASTAAYRNSHGQGNDNAVAVLPVLFTERIGMDEYMNGAVYPILAA